MERITGAINHLVHTFQRLFSGMQFLRMQQDLGGVGPSAFVNNFNQQFSLDDSMLDLARRISLEEHNKKVNNQANKEAVAKLPIIDITL